MRPEQANQGAKERFVTEALVNGLLDHPNIVPVHELGANEQGEVFLAMKLVGSRSWKALLHPQATDERSAAAPYDLDKHLAVLQGVGNAIAFAHSRGIRGTRTQTVSFTIETYAEPMADLSPDGLLVIAYKHAERLIALYDARTMDLLVEWYVAELVGDEAAQRFDPEEFGWTGDGKLRVRNSPIYVENGIVTNGTGDEQIEKVMIIDLPRAQGTPAEVARRLGAFSLRRVDASGTLRSLTPAEATKATEAVRATTR